MDFDPRESDRDDDSRDIEAQWVALDGASGPDRDQDDRHDVRDPDRDHDRAFDPRDPFVDRLKLPRGADRQIVLDGNDRYELNGDDSRTLAAVGAFRVVAERDLQNHRTENESRDPDLRHLRNQGLMESVKLHGRERAVTLTDRGHRLLERNRQDDRRGREQAFDAGVNRRRELAHDAQLYRAYLREAERLHEQGADIRRVVLDQELKSDYRSGCRSPIAAAPTAMGDPIAIRARLNAGRPLTICRISTTTCTFRTSASSTSSMAANSTRTSRS